MGGEMNANLLFSTLKNKVKRLTEELKRKSDFAEELESMVRLSNGRTPLRRTPLRRQGRVEEHLRLPSVSRAVEIWCRRCRSSVARWKTPKV